ncbi:MAG: hypothetical protein L6R41_002149 [Letrouitia leprolyta]|nr:MAG: hypothetical protein L6R41_002149 [Letrouitia leprolyta]
MDTKGYLTRQGWHGNGHALHPSGHGIRKPLLVSKRIDRLGVGKKAHDAHAGQWWSRAFDETLRSLNGEQSKKTIESKSATVIQPGVLAAKWNGNGGLYDSFVKGQGLEGTIDKDKRTSSRKPGTITSKKMSCKGSAKIEDNATKNISNRGFDDSTADGQNKKHSVKTPISLPKASARIRIIQGVPSRF